MEKRIVIVVCCIALCITQTAQCDLIVQEMVAGQKVTLDTATDKYWYWNLVDFTNMTYQEQKNAIAALGTYGYIDGGWHMATRSEMDTLWTNSAQSIWDSFSETGILYGTSPLKSIASGRYEEIVSVGEHNIATLYSYSAPGTAWKEGPLGFSSIPDTWVDPALGAWVVSSHSVVPVPSAVVLGGLGLTFSGWLLRGRRE